MREQIRVTLVSLRDLVATALPFIFLAVGLLAVAYWLLDPAPPRRVVLATGQDQGAYAEFGRRYAQILKENGVEVRLKKTAGAAENIALLRQPGGDVDIAFVQGGADEDRPAASGDDDADADGLVSLGSMFFEPVWLFYREDSAARLAKSHALTSLSQLAGWRINGGTDGSGARLLLQQLLEVNAIDLKSLTLLKDDTTPAVVSFLEGRCDAIVFVSAPESLMVQMLLRTPGVRLFDFTQSEAYARRLAFLSAVVLPRGIVDLARDQPPHEVRMIAPTAILVAREGTHPALQQLLVQAAAQVHGGAGWFQRKGDFPNTHNTAIPISSEAARFYRDGQPFLQRYLPFWLANLIERMAVVLISLIAVLIPLSRVVPPLYTFRIRSRVFRWYGQLRALDEAIGQRPAADLQRELDALEAKVEHVHVPLSYADELYALRSHIAMVRGRVLGEPTASDAPQAGASTAAENNKGRG